MLLLTRPGIMPGLSFCAEGFTSISVLPRRCLIESIKSTPNRRGNAGNTGAGRRAHFSRQEFWRTSGMLWRGGLQYITDRLSGDLYRSLVCGADRRSYKSSHWKLWHDTERCGVEEAIYRRTGDARVFACEFELALDAGCR